MKKGMIFFVLVLFLVLSLFGGCTDKEKTSSVPEKSNSSSNKDESAETVDTEETVDTAETVNVAQSDIEGYWRQVEEDFSGDITDLTDNPYAFMEVTDNRIVFYTISFNEDEGYGFSEKNYLLEKDKIYYDYNELNMDDFKDNMNPIYGGIFKITFDKEGRLELTNYQNNINKDDGYSKDTYVKIPASEWPIEE